MPEPWGTRLIQEAGGKLFLDEKDLWPNGQFPTTTVIARADFLEKHPDVVLNFLRAHIDTTAWIAANPEDAKKLVNDGIQKLTSKALKQATIDEAWKHIAVTERPARSGRVEVVRQRVRARLPRDEEAGPVEAVRARLAEQGAQGEESP